MAEYITDDRIDFFGAAGNATDGLVGPPIAQPAPDDTVYGRRKSTRTLAKRKALCKVMRLAKKAKRGEDEASALVQ